MRLGIVGLKGSGKTTIFNAITDSNEPVGLLAQDPDTVHLRQVNVPDERLNYLQQVLAVPRKVHSSIDIVDVPGIRVGAELHRGENERILGHMRTMDALMLVIRYFDDPRYPHPLGSLDPKRDLSEVNSEVAVADLSIAETRIEKLKVSIQHPTAAREAEKKELELLEQIAPLLSEGSRLDSRRVPLAEEKILRSFQFLSAKKRIVAINLDEGRTYDGAQLGLADPVIGVYGELEMEIEEIEETDRAAFFQEMGIEHSALERVIRSAYQALGLVTFFTHNEKEVRAWAIPSGTSAVHAAGKVHTDMEKGFIRAEVIHFDDFKACGSVKEARHRGKYRLEGRDYVVTDGDIIQFRFSV